jgi:hypothetical protein
MWVSSPQASTDIKPRLAETEAAWNTTLPSFQTIDEGHAEQGKLEPGVVKFNINIESPVPSVVQIGFRNSLEDCQTYDREPCNVYQNDDAL